MVGDFDFVKIVEFMYVFVVGGVDVIEFGVLFLDLMVDGLVIQCLLECVFVCGVMLKSVFVDVKCFCEIDFKIFVVLMGYVNLIEWMGVDVFVVEVYVVGVDGVLVVDYLLEEVGVFVEKMCVVQIDLIFLLVFMLIDECIVDVGKIVSGYVYYVLFKGVIGVGNLDVLSIVGKILVIKLCVLVLVGVGFGICDVEMVCVVVEVLDVVVIGSCLVQLFESVVLEGVVVVLKIFIVELCVVLDGVGKMV